MMVFYNGFVLLNTDDTIVLSKTRQELQLAVKMTVMHYHVYGLKVGETEHMKFLRVKNRKLLICMETLDHFKRSILSTPTMLLYPPSNMTQMW